MWTIDHVATYPLGPKKDPDCSKNNHWLGADNGWSAKNVNWDGGRILVHPLDACVEKARPGVTSQHVEVTNRYWYALALSLPDGAEVTVDDAFEATSLSDILQILVYRRALDMTLVPGHSKSLMQVPNKPEGQQLTFKPCTHRIVHCQRNYNWP